MWLYSYTHSLPGLLEKVYEQEQALTNEDANKFEVAAAVSSIFEALLETLVQNYEQQQQDKNFNVNPPKIDFPKLPYQCRDVLLKQIMSVGQCVLERPAGSWAPQLRRSAVMLTKVYLSAYRAHGLRVAADEFASCSLNVDQCCGMWHDSDFVCSWETGNIGNRSLALGQLLKFDRLAAQQLAEEFCDCRTLAYLALTTTDAVTGRAQLADYTSRYRDVFLFEVFAVLFSQERLGDMLQLVLTDVNEGDRPEAIRVLHVFVTVQLAAQNLGGDQKAQLQQLYWLMSLQTTSVAPEITECGAAADKLAMLRDQGTSATKRTHAALAVLTSAATLGPRDPQVQALKRLTDLCSIEVAECSSQFDVGTCGVGRYPYQPDRNAMSAEQLAEHCLLGLEGPDLETKYHELCERFSEVESMQRVQDMAIAQRLKALRALDLDMNANELVVALGFDAQGSLAISDWLVQHGQQAFKQSTALVLKALELRIAVWKGALTDWSSELFWPQQAWQSSSQQMQNQDRYVDSSFYILAQRWLQDVAERSGSNDSRFNELQLLRQLLLAMGQYPFAASVTQYSFRNKCRPAHPLDTEVYAEDEV